MRGRSDWSAPAKSNRIAKMANLVVKRFNERLKLMMTTPNLLALDLFSTRAIVPFFDKKAHPDSGVSERVNYL